MPVTIYADTLVFINTVITYLLLRSTQVICRFMLQRARLLGASFIGGFYALTLLIQIPFILSLAFRAIVCIALCLISFGFRSLRSLIRSILVFLLLNGAFAGCMLAIRSAVPQMMYRTGILYCDFKIPFLLLSAAAIYGVILLALRLFSVRHGTQANFAVVTIRDHGQQIKARGFFDTGNQLSDPFTGKPVLIVHTALVRSIIPKDLNAIFTDGPKDLQVIPVEWQSRLRMFPYSSVGGDGLLTAFRCECITIECDKRCIFIENTYIAVSDKKLFFGDYDVLIPGSLLDELKEGERKHEIQDHRSEKMARKASTETVSARHSLRQRTADAASPAEKT